MRLRWSLPLVLAAFAYVPTASADAPQKSTGVIERVVAVVGHKAIFLTELRARAKPFLLRIESTVPSGAQQAAAESQMYSELLDKLIDEMLIAGDAENKRLTVTNEEIDMALTNIAASQKVSIPQVLRLALDQGLTETDYRNELRRQLLEGRLIYLRLSGTKALSSLSEAERNKRLEQERQKWLGELHERAFVEKRL